MEAEEAKFIEEVLRVCPRCGRALPPSDLAPDRVLYWLLDNDPLIRRAYDLGRYGDRDRRIEQLGGK
jgi:hypothetical protein